ncbi:MAG: IPT/TIG domain-containing protein [Dehalococcoidales bacterium]|nr:IPT/TIG domain-containing protein [Dehalococcoidales bacterium]
MKHNKVFRILALAVVLSLLMLAIPATPALAAALMTLSPDDGPPGTLIVVTGTGFTASTAGEAWFDSDGDSIRDTGEPYDSFMTDGSGNIPAGVTLTVPIEPRGYYYVRVEVPYDTTADADASASFEITPEIELDDSSGNVGDTITVDGYGFYDSATVTIYYDGDSVGTDYTDSDGTFDDFTFTVPDSTKGTHTVKARDSAGYSPTVTFTVSPEITISSSSGAVGDTITVSGTGFAASSDIIIYFDGSSVGTDNTDSDGSFSGATFNIPETSRGSHTIKAKDDDNNYDTATFTVAQKITIDPTNGFSGITVTVTGTGFKASYTITIKYNNYPVTTVPTTVTTNPTGYFSATFNVPASMAGTYVVEATDGTNTATANFVSTTDATISQTTTTAAPGYVGMQLTITGTGFKASSTITITYTSTPVVFTTTSLADGSFTYVLTIPPSTGGSHTITVTDGAVTKIFDFFMELNAPPTPTLTLPLTGEKAKAEASFEWDPVSDVSPASSPVTYDLQVAADATFTTLLVNKTGLTTPAYTLLEEEKLESTSKEEPYYWRVRAVDAASNASDWSYASTFYVGFTFEFTGWVVYVTMALIAVAFFFLGLWLGRRARGGAVF